MIKIGERIREARQEKNMTQTGLAKKLHVAQNTVSQWETGVAEPSVEMIKKIAVALGCDPNFLLGFDN